ncbi:ceramide synthase isoform X5 [Salmo salar]|uniref:Ceramide synthase isoform X5 n=1 Tax=Salmo salar TaxID=8030 RepID=A0A1S3NH07_SALSA|nr:ceramide synthase isoform X5 [Salmo salar]|eukprot:XP_014014744.1 PREDICTED: protein FAM57B-like isoform X4 [Salmo salar]
MLTILAAGSVFFPGLFVLSKQCLKHIPALRWSEGDAVIVSARLVSSVQAIMASSAGYIIASSCDDIVEDQHWLTSAYILFAVPYFVYDIYAMFMCYWYKLRIKGHEADSGAKPLGAALTSYLRREFLMVLHHIVMVTVCFPVSVFWRQGKGDYFQGVMFLAEVSTPWVCLGKILIQDELIPEAAPRRRRQRRVQTATHSPAQSEWGYYAGHFFHLSSPPLPLPLLRVWQVRVHSPPHGSFQRALAS